MQDIAIFGAGGAGRELMAVLEAANRARPQYNILGFYVDTIAEGTIVNGHPCLGGIDRLNARPRPIGIVLGLGSPADKQAVLSRITNPRVTYPTIIHPSAIIDSPETVRLGRGVIIQAGVIIAPNVVIDDFVYLNRAVTIGHDVHIGAFGSLMPQVAISGNVTVGPGCYIGVGAKTIEKLTIGPSSTIGAGAVVISSLPAGATAVGVPARIIKQNEMLKNPTGGGNLTLLIRPEAHNTHPYLCKTIIRIHTCHCEEASADRSNLTNGCIAIKHGISGKIASTVLARDKYSSAVVSHPALTSGRSFIKATTDLLHGSAAAAFAFTNPWTGRAA